MRLYSIIIAIFAVVTITLFGVIKYDGAQSLVIKGQLIGLEERMVYLETGAGDSRIVVDSAELSEVGKFKIKLKGAEADPSLYELKYGWERIPILASRGESINITSIGRFSYNYTIDGSDESALLRSFYQPYIRKSDELRKIATEYAELQNRGENSNDAAMNYNKLYNEIKRDQLKFIISNKGDMAALYALFQRLPGDSYLINENSDVIYMRTVADSLAHNYPNAPLLKVLTNTIAAAEDMSRVINSITYSDFPEIEMEDMFGTKQKLSQLKGSVILLDFWSAGLSNSAPHNAELKEIYKDYKESGFEIYQVGVDTSKQTWVNAIQTQRLPWISVSDLRGGNSPAVGLYNVTQLPSNILISKSGEIVGRDLFGDQLREALKIETAK